jgi:hypothetical protein
MDSNFNLGRASIDWFFFQIALDCFQKTALTNFAVLLNHPDPASGLSAFQSIVLPFRSDRPCFSQLCPMVTRPAAAPIHPPMAKTDTISMDGYPLISL